MLSNSYNVNNVILPSEKLLKPAFLSIQ